MVRRPFITIIILFPYNSETIDPRPCLTLFPSYSHWCLYWILIYSTVGLNILLLYKLLILWLDIYMKSNQYDHNSISVLTHFIQMSHIGCLSKHFHLYLTGIAEHTICVFYFNYNQTLSKPGQKLWFQVYHSIFIAISMCGWQLRPWSQS